MISPDRKWPKLMKTKIIYALIFYYIFLQAKSTTLSDPLIPYLYQYPISVKLLFMPVTLPQIAVVFNLVFSFKFLKFHTFLL
jgi:uncharacterized membrane protein